jgi:O-antigen/teichoic acid export membrane protein
MSGFTRGFWALSDQAVVSLGTFAASILLARGLPQQKYGLYALLFGLFLLLNVVHGALVTYPLQVKGAAADVNSLRGLVGKALALTGVLLLPLGAVMFGVTWAMGSPQLAFWALSGLAFWQLQETLRRGLAAHLHFREALLGDAFSYLGQAGLIWVFARTGELSLERAFAAMALASAVGAVVQAIQLGLARIASADMRQYASSCWTMGRWALLAGLGNIVTFQALPWALAYFHGLEEAAAFRAVANLLGVTHPVMLGVGNLILSAAARGRLEGGVAAARRSAMGYAAQGWLLLLPYSLALLLWPELALRLFYGEASPYVQLLTALRIFVLAYTFFYLAQVMGSLLNALEASRSTFLAQLAGIFSLAALGLPLLAVGGVVGACAGALAVNVSCSAVAAVLIRGTTRRGSVP